MPGRTGPAMLLAAVGVFGWLVLNVPESPPIVDEAAHRDQILLFMDGHFEQEPRIPLIPGYHILLAALAAPFGIESISGLRAITTILGLLSVVAFFALARQQGEESPERWTLQYLFQPLVFPFIFLVYTDTTSLALLLGAAYLVRGGRRVAGGVVGILSVLVRQTNIFWLGFLVAWDFVRSRTDESAKDAVLSTLRNHAVLVASLPVFGAFAVINGGVTLGSGEQHDLGIYTGNLWFFLVAGLVALAPLHAANWRKVFDLASRPVVIAALVTGFVVFWLTFGVPHPYNTLAGFVRTGLLEAMVASPLVRAAVYVLVAYAALSFAAIRLRQPADYLIYPFAVLALLPLPLIEQRYGLFPLVWIMLTRERQSDVAERDNWIYGAAVSVLALVAASVSWFLY